MEDWMKACSKGDSAALAQLIDTTCKAVPGSLSVFEGALKILTSKASKQPTPLPGNALEGKVLARMANVKCVHPRGRFELLVKENCFVLTSKTVCLSVEWKNVLHVIKVKDPEPSTSKVKPTVFALPLQEPVAAGKSKLGVIALQAGCGEVVSEGGRAPISISGKEVKIPAEEEFGLLLCAASGQSLIETNKQVFDSSSGDPFIQCNMKVQQGSLFPLEQGLLFYKPCRWLSRDGIGSINCGRAGAAHTRYVDLIIGLEDEGQEVEFTNITRENLQPIQQYVTRQLVAHRNSEERKERAAQAAAAGAIEKEMEAEDDSSDSSGDEDFAPHEGSDSSEEEDGSGSDDGGDGSEQGSDAAGDGSEQGSDAAEESDEEKGPKRQKLEKKE
ncbi:unnamed protein product [Chrysoparadoxa australica]